MIKFICFILIIVIIRRIKDKNMKVGVCTVGKLKNIYIAEFVKHYQDYGVDTIFLYDNNDKRGERFNWVLKDYIKNKFVRIFNCRGRPKIQLAAYRDCYNRNKKEYEWLLFIDIDEFIYLRNTNIKDYLKQNKFKKCPAIYMNWEKHTNNNIIYYNKTENKTLKEKLPAIYKNKKYCVGKTILKGRGNSYSRIFWSSVHVLDKRIKKCNNFGEFITLKNNIFCPKPDFKYYYIDHYEFKSTEEFINKIQKGDCRFGFNQTNLLKRIANYFKFNELTMEKVKFIELKMGINYTSYKHLINSSGFKI